MGALNSLKNLGLQKYFLIVVRKLILCMFDFVSHNPQIIPQKKSIATKDGSKTLRWMGL
jgi:hypothetical protein